jgi:pimeloyl-ACP methyl ester carboxylesterase
MGTSSFGGVSSASIKTWVGLSLVGLALVLPASPGSAHALDFAPCGEPDGILCATITVPLDRSGKIPGSIGIFIHKKPATSGKSSGALFYLVGGPGVSGTAGTADVAAALGPELETRDLYVMDYRGVGLSGALGCPFPTPMEADWRRCADELGPARHLYTMREVAEDIEDVRRALGLGRISIFAESYGTKYGQAYALRYGDHIDRLVLDSIIPLNGWDALDLPQWRALGRILREICTAGRCRGITRDPLTDVASLAKRALKKPFVVSYVNANGTVVRHTFNWRYDFWHIFYSDLSMEDHVLRARWPSAVRSALAGDTYPLGRLLAPDLEALGAHGSSEFNAMAWHATKCEELASEPWRGITGFEQRVKALIDAVGALPADTAYPLPRDLIVYAPDAVSCINWPEASAPPVIQPRTRFTGPTLIVSSTQDTRTPLEDARTATTLFPGSTFLTIPDMGHVASAQQRTPKCALTALDDFFAGRSVGTCPATVEPLFPPAPVAPASLAKVQPWPGIGGTRGKTLRSALETVLDVRYTAYSALAQVGLRGGTLTKSSTSITRNGRPASLLGKVTLKRIVYVPGVVVSGVVDGPSGTGTITIAGSFARGKLTIANGRVTGRLAGKPVTVTYKPLLLGVLNRR